MSLPAIIRQLDARLRVMLIATALLVVPQIGQFTTIYDLNARGHESGLSLLFMFAGIFLAPTSFILSVATLVTIRRHWRAHQPLVLLGGLNLLIIINLVWFFSSACSWSQLFGIALKTCSQ